MSGVTKQNVINTRDAPELDALVTALLRGVLKSTLES